uniref:Glyco_transf_64 domain-containing protein n=1 Tax=Angiostrongylus cantonensis TaxID=6313 RepID=A0A158PCW4_ANGCA
LSLMLQSAEITMLTDQLGTEMICEETVNIISTTHITVAIPLKDYQPELVARCLRSGWHSHPKLFIIQNVQQHQGNKAALSLLRSRKQYYFAIDEMSSQLVYYKDESDLVAKREPIGVLSLANAAFTGSDGHPMNDYNLILPLSRHSCSASRISTDMALSVLERKLNYLDPLARSHSNGIEDSTTNRGPSEAIELNASLFVAATWNLFALVQNQPEAWVFESDEYIFRHIYSREAAEPVLDGRTLWRPRICVSHRRSSPTRRLALFVVKPN